MFILNPCHPGAWCTLYLQNVIPCSKLASLPTKLQPRHEHPNPIDQVGIGGTGKIVCTQPKESVYLLNFSNPPDNRLVTPFCQAMILALDILEDRYPRGVVVTTSAIGKFYSNGMDIDHAVWTGG